MLLAKIDSLAIDTVSNDLVLILKTEDEGAILPIWIGNSEAIAIALALSQVTPPRPMTHDLISNMLNGFDVKLLRIVISALVGNTYYALLYFQKGDELVVIDARPSDSVAIATRTKSPIFIQDDVPTISADEDDEKRQDLELRLRRIDPEQIFGG